MKAGKHMQVSAGGGGEGRRNEGPQMGSAFNDSDEGVEYGCIELIRDPSWEWERQICQEGARWVRADERPTATALGRTTTRLCPSHLQNKPEREERSCAYLVHVCVVSVCVLCRERRGRDPVGGHPGRRRRPSSSSARLLLSLSRHG